MKKIFTESNYEVIPLDTRTNVCFYTSIDPQSYVPPHWHDAIEIIYLLEGELKIISDGITQELQHRQCILIQPNKIHATLCTRPNKAIVFQIPLSFMEKFVPGASRLTFQLNDSPGFSASDTLDLYVENIRKLKRNLEEMQFIMDTKPDGAMLLFNGLLFQVLYQLYHDFSSSQPAASNNRQVRNLEKLKPVLDYINDNYRHPIALEEVSRITMFDSKYFCRFFKKCMGTTFLEYQNQIRLSHIYQDLISTDDKIGDILERHGFTNYKLFRRMFFQHFGCTPTEVRRRISCTF